jgi:hypothetical protein
VFFTSNGVKGWREWRTRLAGRCDGGLRRLGAERPFPLPGGSGFSDKPCLQLIVPVKTWCGWRS